MSRRCRATPALRAYIRRFAPRPAAPKAPPVENPYHRFYTRNRSLEELTPIPDNALKKEGCVCDLPVSGPAAKPDNPHKKEDCV